MLANGATASFTIVARVDPGRADGSSIANTGSVSSSTYDPGSGNDSATASITVRTSADLSTTVADSPDPVAPGSATTYHVRLHNQGPSDASAPRVSMPIPAQTTLVAATQASGPHFTCTHDAATITCDGASLPAGSDATFDFVVRTARAATGSITARPEASASTSDPDASNNVSTETTTVTPAPNQRITIGRAVERPRSGVILVPVTCRNFTQDFCDTRVTITFNSPGQTLAPITRSVRLASGARSTVLLVAPRAERLRIKRIRRLPATVTATNPPGSPASRDVVLAGSPR
jgi:uncharacterized repeat protein (TIGR01451 family)